MSTFHFDQIAVSTVKYASKQNQTQVLELTYRNGEYTVFVSDPHKPEYYIRAYGNDKYTNPPRKLHWT